jgi:hypothetical protein
MRLNIYNNKDVSDIPLIGNPQITYFSSVYRKHTDFVIKRHEQRCDPGNIHNEIFQIGDLIKSIDLKINIEGNSNNIISNIGTSLIDNIKLHISDKSDIEELIGEYIEMYMELNNPRGVHTFYSASGTGSSSELICEQGTMEQILSLSGGVFQPGSINASKVNIVLPIQFSFCKDIGHAFPIFLLGSNKFNISFKINELLSGTYTYKFVINYIFLKNNEKMRFKASTNEYLHEIIKYQEFDTNKNILEISSIGNIKSLIWKTNNIDYKYNIHVNDRKLFNKDKSYQYFTRKTISEAGFPGGSASGNSNVIHDDSIAYYTFALKGYNKDDPLAPTGSISSSANKIKLYIVNNNNIETFKVYTTSYNIINISEEYFKLDYQH